MHVSMYIPAYICVCVCTGICHRCPVSFEACQMCRLTDISVCISPAAALHGFIFLPTFAAGWRTGGIFCNAGLSLVLLGQGFLFMRVFLGFFLPLLALTC